MLISQKICDLGNICVKRNTNIFISSLTICKLFTDLIKLIENNSYNILKTTCGYNYM